MSDAPDDFRPDDLDLLAGMFVLGTLEAEEARAVEALAARDPAVAAAIEEWRGRLAPLALAVPPVPPPASLWTRIASSTGAAPAPAGVAAPAPRAVRAPTIPQPQPRRPSALGRTWRSPGFWRATTVGALALAAAFAGVAYLGGAPAPQQQMAAALAPMNAPAPVFLAESRPDGTIMVRPLTPVSVAAGKDMELWALPQGATRPVSLGVMPADGRMVKPAEMPPAKTQLLISLEPRGGSPTGLPTGPVLYAGTLVHI